MIFLKCKQQTSLLKSSASKIQSSDLFSNQSLRNTLRALLDLKIRMSIAINFKANLKRIPKISNLQLDTLRSIKRVTKMILNTNCLLLMKAFI